MTDAITKLWTRSKADEHAVDAGCVFDLATAERVPKFFRQFLRHSKGEWAGQPFELLEWQERDIIMPLYGWKRPDGTRRYRKAYVEVPKKNGKSTLCAGVGLYSLAGDGEPGAEVYSTAADQAQAGIVHGEAINMVDSSPELSASLEINRSTKTIAYHQKKSKYAALSGEAPTKEGLNAHCIIVDELHIWRGRKLWDALKYAFRARRQGLLFVITTAGDDMHSVCREQHDYAQTIIDGNHFDDRYFAYIRSADIKDDWKSPETWKKANPSFGITIKADEFAADVAEAEKSPTTQSAFKRYSLNIWATATHPWLDYECWKVCAQAFTREELRGQTCFAAFDFAATQDMTALSLCFPQDDGSFRLLLFFWLPEARIESPDCPENYRVWGQQKLVTFTPGNVTDFEFVKAQFIELAQEFNIQKFAYDPWNAEAITQQIESESGVPREKFPQTPQNFAEPTKDFERLVISGKMNHNDNPVLNWQAGHVSVKRDANGNIRPVKPTDGRDSRKIDGLVASVMAFGLARQPGEASVYDTRGLQSI